MRPDRIILGEVRGEEALDMLQAMNTGHDGSLATIHANSCADAINRLEMMAGSASANISSTSLRQQIASAIHVYVQVARLSDGSRKIVEIAESEGLTSQGTAGLKRFFRFERDNLSDEGTVEGRFVSLETDAAPRPRDRGQARSAGHLSEVSTVEAAS
jgi:pilus assembly protein CpaF